jgi:hypothetical protein
MFQFQKMLLEFIFQLSNEKTFEYENSYFIIKKII